MAGDRATRLLEALRWQRLGVERPSPLYHRILGLVIADVERGGPGRTVLLDRGDPGPDPSADAYVLRFLGGIHRLVLSGAAPALARWYPSVGGTAATTGGDHRALGEALGATVEEHADALVAALLRPVQTNEVGRCAALLVGFLAVAEATGQPLRLLEVGASAGLNLRWDHYRYEGGADGSCFGDPASPLRFDDVYRDPRPPLTGPVTVAERRGCDRNPLDPLSEDGLLTLRSFVWPDQLDRLARLDAAVEVARTVPVTVDETDAGPWVAEQLAEPVIGAATVLYHSIVWQYLAAPTKAMVLAALDTSARSASPASPLAWLRFEPADDPAQGAEVRLTTWPGAEERLLTRGGYHGKPVRAVGLARP